MGLALQDDGSQAASATAKLCLMMDKCFDCLNVRHQFEHERKRKESLKPYAAVDDERFDWLRMFLRYLADWKSSADNRPGTYSKSARNKMFLSRQTHDGLTITINSAIELTQFMLRSGAKFILTERFCQDILESYFGMQRMCGGRTNNPNMYNFGYADNIIKNARKFTPLAGANVRIVEE